MTTPFVNTSVTPFAPNVPPPPSPPVLYSIAPCAVESIEYRMRMRQEEKGWSHSRPNSVLIWTIGNHWKPGAWQHVLDMMKYTVDQGIYVELREGQDRCFEYADALGVMRNEGIFLAENLGVEWICLLENDVWPPKETLVRLLQHHDLHRANILVPYMCEMGTGRPLHGPTPGPDTGFHWMKWSVLSMLMVKVCIFKHYREGFWDTAIGADEGYHFQKLFRDGYYLGMDSGVQVPTLARPNYPLATNHLTDADRRQHWEYINRARLSPPDRRPLDPNATMIDEHGSYNPFIRPPQETPNVTSAGTPADQSTSPPADVPAGK